MEGLSVARTLDHAPELHFARVSGFSPISSSDKLALLETLMTQENLPDLLQAFAAWISQHLPICHLAYVWMEQRIEVLNLGRGAYKQHSPLVDNKMHLLGHLDYELTARLNPHQQRLMQQLHQLLINPLRLFLKMEEMDQQCRMDHLTGVGNRAYFDEALQLAIEQNMRQPNGLTLMLVDLDDFKQINDTHGHPIGDSVLKTFADLLTTVVRGTDMVFRLGGDEFAIMFQPADEFTAVRVLIRLQKRLAQHPELKRWNTACSIGYENWKKGMSAKELYHLADEQLYHHKNSRHQSA
ncbi:GGDEF domain-containing protein [Tolumonas lignilytica]|jgi:diguanylate cyclase (GGDEF) domain|uniref:GGDEF domain-containing protein n=1 Tax=Tolumonas lignilytica TaxID=1283284 RepID=UPI000464FCAD|nr:GGDEF domain-containing protein [Tolumonas lignilytica]